MTRTNIDIDDELIAEIMTTYKFRTKREAVDFALRRARRPKPMTVEEALALRGSNFIDPDYDLDRIRGRGKREVMRVASGSRFEGAIGFSRAVVTDSRVLVSGTAPVWPDGSVDPDAGAQARRCFEIIAAALAEAGAGMTDVVRTRMFVTSSEHADAVGAVHGEVLGDVRPAATMVVVAALLDPRWVVEIEAEAVR